MPRVVSVAPVLAPYRCTQDELSGVIAPLVTADPGRQELLRRLHSGSGVRTRHVALPLAEYAGLTSFGRANDAFLRIGTDLAEQAARQALADAGLTGADVDVVFFTSVTGIGAPSIDAALVERLGMRQDVRRVPSFGLGCAGGAAGTARLHDMLLGHPGAVGLLVSVELCSLTLQHGDGSTANLVATGLFGDGAAAVVLVGDEHPLAADGAQRPQVVDTASRLYPGTADQLGWTVRDSGLQILLSPGLPAVVERHLGDDVAALLDRHDAKVRDVTSWVVHAGGPKIVDAVRTALDLDAADLTRTTDVLAATGNLSSASVLHVLAAHLRDAPPPPGAWGVMIAFGPGVTAELVLLRWG